MLKKIQLEKVQDDGSIWVDMVSGEDNPCESCGACCSHFRVSFYNGETDAMRDAGVPVEMVVQVTPFLVAMKGTECGGRCVALKGEIGKKISCGIYQNRSSSCRAFPVWMEDGSPNPKCQELRVKNGIPLLLPNRY
jgi:uncharacterized protein